MALLNVPTELADHIRKEAGRLNYQLLDVSTKGGNAFFMEVIIDKEGGITLEECSEFNRRISSWIDEKNLLKRGYTLDVCSPGLDRELKSDGDYSWALEKDVKVTTHEPVEGKNVITGKLVEVDGEKNVTIEEADGKKTRIDRSNIAKARLWVEIR